MRVVLLCVSWVLLAGCAAEEEAPATRPASGACTKVASCAADPDPDAPPVGCGPQELCVPACKQAAPRCPADPCMSQVPQEGDVVALRIGRSVIVAPKSLASVAAVAVDPNVTPRCAGGTERFSWILKIDRKNGTITTGGARPSADGKTFRFARESIDPKKIESVCPGFGVAAEPIAIGPVTSTLVLEGNRFHTPKAKKVNVPIFQDGDVPLVLPLSESEMRDVTLSGSCIGRWDPGTWCDGDTRGWTTGGAITSKITAEDADRVPLKIAGCMSLCAILANDPSLVENGRCKRGPDGKIPEIGDTCVGGTGCKNAFRLVSTFAAYGVALED